MSDLRENVTVLYSPYELRTFRKELLEVIQNNLNQLPASPTWENFLEARGELRGMKRALDMLDDLVKKGQN